MMKIHFLLPLVALLLFSWKNNRIIPLNIVGNAYEKQLFNAIELKENPTVEKHLLQIRDGNFDVVISSVRGDLNKDGVEDLVTVKQDTVSQNRPYRLQIYLTQADKKRKLVLSSDSAIVAMKSEGNIGFAVTLFTGIEIKSGTLIISHELTRGSFTHQFRFQNNKFELIGYRSAGVSPPDVEEIDFNLSTGNKIIKRTPIGGDKVKSIKKSKEFIRPLPNLKFFEPYECQY